MKKRDWTPFLSPYEVKLLHKYETLRTHHASLAREYSKQREKIARRAQTRSTRTATPHADGAR